MKFELKTFNRNVPDEDLLNDLRRVAEECGGANMTSRKYNGKGKYSSSTISERFGSWNNALEEAGLIVKEHKNISIEEFIFDLRKVAEEFEGSNMTSRQYNGKGKYSPSAISDRFGSWNNAVEQAGLKVKEYKNISIEALFENI